MKTVSGKKEIKEANVKELIKKAKTEKDYEQMLIEMLEREFN